jgi:spore coat protein U-like protein
MPRIKKIILCLLLSFLYPTILKGQCNFTAGRGSLNFGQINPLQNVPIQNISHLFTVSCNGVSVYQYSFKLSAGGDNIYNPYRHMIHINQNSKLKYNLYIDPQRTIIWGDGTNGTSFNQGNPNGGCQENFPCSFQAYGLVPLPQLNVPGGVYRATITAIFEY